MITPISSFTHSFACDLVKLRGLHRGLADGKRLAAHVCLAAGDEPGQGLVQGCE
jgi:hypothetical protein